MMTKDEIMRIINTMTETEIKDCIEHCENEIERLEKKKRAMMASDKAFATIVREDDYGQ